MTVQNQIKQIINEINEMKKNNKVELFDKNKSFYQKAVNTMSSLDELDDETLLEIFNDLKMVHANLLKLINPQKNTVEVMYKGGIKFKDFKNLTKINNFEGENEIYALFDPTMIADYEKATIIEQEDFKRTMQSAKFCRSEGQSGLKSLGHNAKIVCKVWLNQHTFETTFSHELKIGSSPSRIGFIQLVPNTSGPIIMLATHFIKDGFHHSNVKQKEYATLHLFNKLVSPAKLCQQFGAIVRTNHTKLVLQGHKNEPCLVVAKQNHSCLPVAN